MQAVQSASHGTDFSRSGLPDRDRRQQAHGNSDRKGQRITAGQIVQSARDPRARRASAQCHEHDGAKDAAVMPALENLEHHRAHDRGQPVAERALREYHQVDQRQCGCIFQRDQARKADRKA